MTPEERVARLERDLATLAGLGREQQAEIRLLRSRLAQLRASRWRKLGQRLGLVKRLEWEDRDEGAMH